jgi:hypothetical protein
MGKKELTTLVTRAKSAGNNKHDVKKERKKTKIAWEERSLVH